MRETITSIRRRSPIATTDWLFFIALAIRAKSFIRRIQERADPWREGSLFLFFFRVGGERARRRRRGVSLCNTCHNPARFMPHRVCGPTIRGEKRKLARHGEQFYPHRRRKNRRADARSHIAKLSTSVYSNLHSPSPLHPSLPSRSPPPPPSCAPRRVNPIKFIIARDRLVPFCISSVAD